ncbi:hypothetical protein Tco_1126898 [Tanacetum coccineum]
MDIFVISVSSDSLEESVGTSAGRVILFGTIPTTIPDTTPTVTPPITHIDTTLTPASPDYTPSSPDYSPTSDLEFDPSEDPSSDHIPPLLATSPFLSSIDDSSDSDILDTPPSPTHVMILAPRQPIPHGRPYRYHPNEPVHMMTASKRVRLLHTHRLDVRHLVSYSFSDHFTSDDSSRDSSSSSSSKTSSYSSSDDLSNSSSDHSSSALPSGPSRKRSRSPTTFVPLSSPILGALSPARVDLLPPPKRIRSFKFVTDLEVSPAGSSEPSRSRGTDLEMNVDVKRCDEPHSEPEIDPVETVIEACFDLADIIRGSRIDVRVEVVTVAQDEVKTSTRGTVVVSDDRVTHPVVPDDIPESALGDLVQRFHDHTMKIPVRKVQVIESIQRDQGHMIVASSQQSTMLLERIHELERDNKRLRDMMDVASQRVTRFWRRELRVQRETMPNTRSGATMTREGINELIARQVTEALEARDAARNLEPLVEGGDDKGNSHGNGNGNGGGNGYGNHNGNFRGFMHVARECTYQDFLMNLR